MELTKKDQSLREWAQIIWDWAEIKGWNEQLHLRTEGEWCALEHTEISEAFEAWRTGKSCFYVDEDDRGVLKPEGIAVEKMDAVIRILHWFAYHSIDPNEIMLEKMKYNYTRTHRHGGKLV